MTILAVSSLTLAEVLVASARDDRMEQVRAALDDLDVQELPFLPTLPLPRPPAAAHWAEGASAASHLPTLQR